MVTPAVPTRIAPTSHVLFALALVVSVSACKPEPFPNPDSLDAGPDGPDAGPGSGSNGWPCVLASGCSSGYCVDGVCCDTECATQCHACTALLKGNGEDGICGNIKPGNEPATECTNGACSVDGVCSSASPTNTCNTAADCASGFCVGGFCCAQSSCTAVDSCHLATCSSGTCTQIPWTCPGGGTCSNGLCPGLCTGIIGLSDGPLFPTPQSKDKGTTHVVLGDIDGDGLLDVVTSFYWLNAFFYGGSIGVHRNNGDGTFTVLASLDGSYEDVLGLADMNNDGTLDIVQSAYQGSGGQNLKVYLNDGQGGFTQIYVGLGVDVSKMNKQVIADLNNDGYRDVMVKEAFAGRLLAKLNNAGTTFGATLNTTITGYADFDATDLNADGKADLVLASTTTSNVEVRFGNGNGTFGSPVVYPSVMGVNAVALRDIDLDGDNDLVASNGVDTHVRIHMGNAVFAAATTYNGGSADIADINGDGRPDILGATTLFNTGNGTFAPQTMAYMPHKNASFGDVNGDGLVDIARIDSKDEGARLLLNRGNGAFTQPYTQLSGVTFGRSADLNGDNLDDLARASSSSTVAVRINMGNDTYAPDVTYPTGVVDLKAVSPADMNGDGQIDLVASGDTYVGVLFNMGGGIFGPAVTYPVKPILRNCSTTGDFNGDGYPDLARFEAENAALSVMFNQGDGTLGPRGEIATFGFTPGNIQDLNELEAADLNGDGAADLVVHGYPYILEVFMSDGLGGFVNQPQVPGLFGPWIDWMWVDDFDNDQYPDIAVVRSNAPTKIYLNNGDGTFHYGLQALGLGNATIHATVDVDRNGFKDIVLITEGVLAVHLNDGLSFRPRILYRTNGFFVSATDIDGDGISELLTPQGALHRVTCVP